MPVSRRLQQYLDEMLMGQALPSPSIGESEPQYTARVLQPLIVSAIRDRVSSDSVWVKGDGASERAYSRSFAGFGFHPDIAVGEGSMKYWCAEVKLTRDSFNGDVIAKALGQALLYHDVFETVTVVLLNSSKNASSGSILHNFNEWLTVIEISNFA